MTILRVTLAGVELASDRERQLSRRLIDAFAEDRQSRIRAYLGGEG